MRKIVSFTAAAALALGLGSLAANAQAPFYQCQITASAAGTTNSSANGVCQLDPQRMKNWSATGLILTYTSPGNMTASVEITGDVPVNISGGGNWIAETNLGSLTAGKYDLLSIPVTGIRLNVTPYVQGTITLNVVQPAINK